MREVDLQKKYYLSAQALASRLKLTPPKAKALRDHLGIDSDETCRHVFVFGSQKIPRYSDNAFNTMCDYLNAQSIDAIWAARKELISAHA